MTPIADMVEQMHDHGVSFALILLAIRTAETAATLPITPGNALPVTRSRKAVNQANYRARKQAKPGESVAMAAPTAPVTHPATPGNAVTANVTSVPLSILSSLLPSSEVQSGNQEVESKKEVSNKLPRARTKREKTRMADDWRPDDKGMRFAGDHGLRLYEIEIEITKCRNYWINRDEAKPRWDLAWENWILNVKGLSRERTGQVRTHSNAGPPQTHGDAIVTGMARYAARRFGAEPPACDARGAGEVRGRDDAPDAIDAELDAAPGHRTAL